MATNSTAQKETFGDLVRGQPRPVLSAWDGNLNNASQFNMPTWDPSNYAANSTLGMASGLTSVRVRQPFMVLVEVPAATAGNSTNAVAISRLPFNSRLVGVDVIPITTSSAEAESFVISKGTVAGGHIVTWDTANTSAGISASPLTCVWNTARALISATGTTATTDNGEVRIKYSSSNALALPALLVKLTLVREP